MVYKYLEYECMSVSRMVYLRSRHVALKESGEIGCVHELGKGNMGASEGRGKGTCEDCEGCVR
jgi:hypothetical protein